MSNASVSEKKHWNQLPLPPQSPFLLISFLSTRQEVSASLSPREERQFASKVQSTVNLWIHGLSSSMLQPTMLTGCCSSLTKTWGYSCPMWILVMNSHSFVALTPSMQRLCDLAANNNSLQGPEQAIVGLDQSKHGSRPTSSLCWLSAQQIIQFPYGSEEPLAWWP